MFPILKQISLTLPIYYKLQNLITIFFIKIKPYIHPFMLALIITCSRSSWYQQYQRNYGKSIPLFVCVLPISFLHYIVVLLCILISNCFGTKCSYFKRDLTNTSRKVTQIDVNKLFQKNINTPNIQFHVIGGDHLILSVIDDTLNIYS